MKIVHDRLIVFERPASVAFDRATDVARPHWDVLTGVLGSLGGLRPGYIGGRLPESIMYRRLEGSGFPQVSGSASRWRASLPPSPRRSEGSAVPPGPGGL